MVRLKFQREAANKGYRFREMKLGPNWASGEVVRMMSPHCSREINYSSLASGIQPKLEPDCADYHATKEEGRNTAWVCACRKVMSVRCHGGALILTFLD